MLDLSNFKHFYYVPGFVNMNWGFYRLLEFVSEECHVIPHEGDVFIFMSRNRKRVRLIYYDKQAYYMNEKTFYNKDYRFMKVEFKDQKTVYSIEWKDLLTLLENPVISVLRL